MEKKSPKCVVWDLDNTLWKGILKEDKTVVIRQDAVKLIRYLDERGILQSIASRNTHEHAFAKLTELGLQDYFLYPQINWSRKSESISNIQKMLNFDVDSFIFLDDDQFERSEVVSVHRSITTAEFEGFDSFINLFDVDKTKPTTEAIKRRALYKDEERRQDEHESFKGSDEEFLKSLGLVFKLALAKKEDLRRAYELTNRTNQLNSTGITYSLEQLENMSESRNYEVILSYLSDSFGDYGIIGLALVSLDTKNKSSTLELFLISCRVMSRGVGGVFLNELINRYLKSSYTIKAKLKKTVHNRLMQITYGLNGFTSSESSQGIQTLRYTGITKENPTFIELLNELPSVPEL